MMDYESGMFKMLELGSVKFDSESVSVDTTKQFVPLYAAPEVLHDSGARATRATLASDVWGLGLTLYTILTGSSAFDASLAPGPLLDALRNSAVRPRVPAECRVLCRLLRGAWDPNPEVRPTAAEMLLVMQEANWELVPGQAELPESVRALPEWVTWSAEVPGEGKETRNVKSIRMCIEGHEPAVLDAVLDEIEGAQWEFPTLKVRFVNPTKVRRQLNVHVYDIELPSGRVFNLTLGIPSLYPVDPPRVQVWAEGAPRCRTGRDFLPSDDDKVVVREIFPWEENPHFDALLRALVEHFKANPPFLTA
jgi:serine/threonine protein kinase